MKHKPIFLFATCAMLISITFKSISQERIEIISESQKNRTDEPKDPLVKFGTIYTLYDATDPITQPISKVDPKNLVVYSSGTLDRSDFQLQEISGICYDAKKDEIVGITPGENAIDCGGDPILKYSYLVRYRENTSAPGGYEYLGKVPILINGTSSSYLHCLTYQKMDIEIYNLPFQPITPVHGSGGLSDTKHGGNEIGLYSPSSRLIIYGYNYLNKIVRIEWDYVSNYAYAYDVCDVGSTLSDPLYQFNTGAVTTRPSAITIKSIDHLVYENDPSNPLNTILVNYYRDDAIILMGTDPELQGGFGGYTGSQPFCNEGIAFYSINGNAINVEPIASTNSAPCPGDPQHEGNMILGAYNICNPPAINYFNGNIATYNPYHDNSVYEAYIGDDLYLSVVVYDHGHVVDTHIDNSWVVYDASINGDEFLSNPLPADVCNPIQDTKLRCDYAGKYKVDWIQHWK